MKLGEEAMPPSALDHMAPSVRGVLADAFANPGSSVSEITERTGFPQSHVSTSVARLRELGVLVTEPDPGDRRRTLVQPAPGMLDRAIQRSAAPADQTIAVAIGADSQDRLGEVMAALDLIGEVLIPVARRQR
jgi:predicted transcriptional regulator